MLNLGLITLLSLLALYLLLLCMVIFACARTTLTLRRRGVSFAWLPLTKFFRLANQIITGAIQLFWWRMQRVDVEHFGSHQDGSTKPLVFCVHGFQMNGTCFYGVQKHINQAGYDSISIRLGRPYVKVEKYIHAYARQLEAALQQYPSRPIIIVAHSMGGLITRMALAERPDLIPHIKGVITLGTPHKGTAIIGKLSSQWTANLFHPDSPMLAKLPTFSALAPNLPVLTVASEHDLIVYPYQNAHLAEAHNITTEWVSHTGLLTDSVMHQELVNWLDELGQQSL